MATKKKMLQAAAGNAGGGAGPDVEDVFSTYLYETNGTSQKITNGIDLAGEGGLVWEKNRATGSHLLADTERGARNRLITNSTDAQTVGTDIVAQAFNSDGFDSSVVASGYDYASWTFRKAPKFFDVVTYTGDGTSGRTINHNLGGTVGWLLIKRTDSTGNWVVYHRSLGTTGGYPDYLLLESTAASSSGSSFLIHSVSDTSFVVGSGTGVNASGATYVAYLFAHNDGDGEFGGEADADIIKCGSFTGTGSSVAYDIGFEPQWVLWKQTSGTDDWYISDNMRGLHPQDINAVTLRPSQNAAENASGRLGVTSTGFEFDGGNGADYIYIAIRRGTKVPESATEVFDVFTTANGDPAGVYGTVGPVDLNVNKKRDVAYSWRVFDRLRNDYQLNFDSTNADNARDWVDFDEMSGININSTGTTYLTSDSQVHYNWKRAPGFFDVVAYTGNGTAGRTVSHNLGVAPEMIWVKRRESTGVWGTYHSGVDATSPEDFYLKVESTDGRVNDARFWNDTAPDDTVFTLGTHSQVNFSGGDYIAYLFASLDGISKVGSYTGNGGTQTIDCGFTSGARFVLIKGSSFVDNWWVFDTERGIVTGNDPRLYLNTTDAEFSFDYVDPYSAGFAVTDFLSSNGQTYIFYAIA